MVGTNLLQPVAAIEGMGIRMSWGSTSLFFSKYLSEETIVNAILNPYRTALTVVGQQHSYISFKSQMAL